MTAFLAANEVRVLNLYVANDIRVPAFFAADQIANTRVDVRNAPVIVNDAEHDSEQDQQRRPSLDEDGIH